MTSPREEPASRAVTGPTIPPGARLIPHRPGLDGLRGLSVAAVLAYHGGWSWAVGGFLGVSVFFTLSGFLITSLILAEHERKGRVDLVHFWGRRFRRLLPASLLALAGIGVFGLTVATAEQAERLAGDIGAAVAYVANWRFILGDTTYGDLFAKPSPVLHFWSLAIEEQFYLLYPLFMVGLLAITKGRRVPIAVVLSAAALASIAMSFVLGTGDLDRIYFGTDTRAVELLAGALLAMAVLMAPTAPRPDRDAAASLPGSARSMAGWVPSLIGGAAIVALGLAVVTVEISTSWLYRGGFAAISALSCLAIVGATRDGPLANLLSLKPLTWLGLRSYGIYLFHWPIFLWLDPDTTGLDGVVLFALRLVVTLGVSELSYRLVEMPIRYRRPLPRPVLGLAPLGAVTVIVIGVLATATAPAPLVDLAQSVDRLPPPPPVAPAELVLVGDGVVTGPMAAELDASFGRRLGWQVDDLSDPACTILSLDNPDWCPAVDDWVAAAGEARVVVITFGPGPEISLEALGAPDRVAPLTEMRDKLGDDVQVVWVTQPEVLAAGDPPALDIDPNATSWPWQAANNAALVAAGSQAGDVVVDLARYLSLSVENDGTGVSILDHDDERLLSALGWVADQIFEAVGDSVEVDPNAPRVLVVGDSVAYSVGRGLEEWGSDTGDAVVWNVGTTGCGLIRGGEIPDHEIQPSPVCELWPERFASHLAEFSPQVVVVVSTGWDLLERRMPDWPDFLGPGEPRFDEHLLSEYRQVVDSLAARGASVVWVTSPCASPERAAGGSVFSPARTTAQNRLIAQLGETDPRVTVVDLDALVCPGGRFTNEVEGVANFRPDGIHFSDAGARWVADRIGPDLVALARRRS